METLDLKSGEKIKVLNGACMAEIKDNVPVLSGKVGGKKAEVLRDTGCSEVVIRRELVDEANFTGEMRSIAPASDKGHRYILTLVNYATRFPEAVPLKNINTETVAEALLDMYGRVGVPEEVLCDLGTQFTSDCVQEVSRLLSIRKLTTFPYHPACNGLVEKFNGTLNGC